MTYFMTVINGADKCQEHGYMLIKYMFEAFNKCIINIAKSLSTGYESIKSLFYFIVKSGKRFVCLVEKIHTGHLSIEVTHTQLIILLQVLHSEHVCNLMGTYAILNIRTDNF